MSNRIELKGGFVRDEGRASTIILAGNLLQMTAGVTTPPEVGVHATAGGFAEKAFAIEEGLLGLTQDDAYAIGDLVPYVIGKQGSEVSAIIKAGENFARGTALVSLGDGTLVSITNATAVAAGIKQVIAFATEALDLSAGGAVDTRLAVRIA